MTSPRAPRERALRFASIAAPWLAITMVGGCGKSEPPAGGASSAASAASEDAEGGSIARLQARTKLNAYVIVHNGLIGSSGLRGTFADYRALGIGRGGPRSNDSFSKGFFDHTLVDLRKARALPGAGSEEIDTATDALIPPLERLAAKLAELDVYYGSKAYLQDKMAKGKAEDAAVLADFQASLAPGDQFEAAVDRAIVARTAKRLEALKQSGDMLAYDSVLAMSQARTLVESFKTAKDMRDPAVLARTRPMADALDKTLADMRVEIAKARAARKVTRRPTRSSTTRNSSSVAWIRSLATTAASARTSGASTPTRCSGTSTPLSSCRISGTWSDRLAAGARSPTRRLPRRARPAAVAAARVQAPPPAPPRPAWRSSAAGRSWR